MNKVPQFFIKSTSKLLTMNPKSLIKNRKMLAIITGVVLCATLGLSVTSYASADSNQTQQNSGTTQQPPTIQGSINLKQMVASSIKTKFSDAANTAASAVTNGVVISGNLAVKQGYLVYQFKVMDDKNMIYAVIVDAGTGQVLNTSQGHSANIGSFFGMEHQGYGMHKFHMKGFTQQSQQQTQPQSDQQSVPENPSLGT
jgi:uncharacterized membrane protein YkoI